MERYYDNEQYAADFAMYMMASSYFNKAKLVSGKLFERKLAMQFRERRLERQYELEEMCIQFVEEILMNKLPGDIWDNEINVKLFKEPGKTENIVFTGQGFGLVFKIQRRKKNWFDLYTFFENADQKLFLEVSAVSCGGEFALKLKK